MPNLPAAKQNANVCTGTEGNVVLRKWGERLWLTGLLLLAHAVISTGCAHSQPSAAAIGPDMSGVVRVATRSAFAHVCPIGPRLGLTSAHVVDPKWWDPDAPMVGGFGATEFAYIGQLVPRSASSSRDLAVVEVEADFPKWFKIAEQAPPLNVPLYALGYDYRTQSALLATRKHRMPLLRIVGKTLVMDGDSQSGSSGGCVLNAAGEVVAITEGWMQGDAGGRVTLAVGVWGESFDSPLVPAPVSGEDELLQPLTQKPEEGGN